MNTRIRELREHFKLSQTAFADRLGMSRSIVSNMELGAAEIPSYRINAIVKEFNVNRQWLETGEGEMFNPEAEAPLNDYPPIIRAILRSYNRLNPAEQAAFCKFLDSVVEEYESTGSVTTDPFAAAEAAAVVPDQAQSS